MITKQTHTYKTGPNAGKKTTTYKAQAYQGAHQIVFAKTIGAKGWGVSWSSTDIIQAPNKLAAKLIAVYVSANTDGTIDNMRKLASTLSPHI